MVLEVDGGKALAGLALNAQEREEKKSLPTYLPNGDANHFYSTRVRDTTEQKRCTNGRNVEQHTGIFPPSHKTVKPLISTHDERLNCHRQRTWITII